MKVAWSDALSVGNGKIDEQHETLFKMINALGASLDAGFNREIIIQMFIQVRMCAEEHFECEELILKKMDFSAYDSHKQLHEDIKKKIDNHIMDLQNGGGIKFKFHEFLVSWLTDHILMEDSKCPSE